MAGMDYGVIAFKNKKLLEDTDTNREGCYVFNGKGGEFRHSSGLTFYRTSIKDHEDINKAKVVIRVEEELAYKNKKVLYTEIKGLKVKTKHIVEGVYESKFKDNEGDWYTVIHGYDVDFDDFWEDRVGKIIQKRIKKAQV